MTALDWVALDPARVHCSGAVQECRDAVIELIQIVRPGFVNRTQSFLASCYLIALARCPRVSQCGYPAYSNPWPRFCESGSIFSGQLLPCIPLALKYNMRRRVTQILVNPWAAMNSYRDDLILNLVVGLGVYPSARKIGLLCLRNGHLHL